MNMKKLKTFSLILGIIAIVFSLVVFSCDVGSYESNRSYGGDAYTGIQNAAAQAANNIMDVGAAITTAAGAILLVFGVGMIFLSLCINAPKAPKTAPMGAPMGVPYAPPVAAPYAPPAAPVAPAAPAAGTWFCPRCGSQNSGDTTLCKTCAMQRPNH